MLVVSADRSTVVSSLGWVDGGSLWVYSDRSQSSRAVRVSAARYLSLRAGTDDHFAVVHHFESDVVEITVHRTTDVADILARAVVKDGRGSMSGDAAAFARVPGHYTAFVNTPWWSDFGLITVDGPGAHVRVDRFAWFDADTYDKGYQGIGGVTEIPGSHLLLVSIQRSSTVIVHDPILAAKAGEVKLAGRGGNPRLYFRRTASELWADDYDTLLRLDVATWRVLDQRRLQGSASGTRQFIGGFTVDAEEKVCLVARPFHQDVLAVDMRTFRTHFAARTSGQPLAAALLPGARVIARDWKTGALLTGQLRRKRWFV